MQVTVIAGTLDSVFQRGGGAQTAESLHQSGLAGLNYFRLWIFNIYVVTLLPVRLRCVGKICYMYY